MFKSLFTKVGNALVNEIEVPTEEPVNVADQLVTPTFKPTTRPQSYERFKRLCSPALNSSKAMDLAIKAFPD